MSESRVIDANDFIHKISGAVRSGFGTVPLFGSGMSAPSGILMGLDFSSYLAYSVKCALEGGWNFHTNNWPTFPAPEKYDETRNWVYKEFKGICERNGYVLLDDHQRLVKSIAPDFQRKVKSQSYANGLNCPPCPAAIRSPEFDFADQELNKLRQTIRKASGANSSYCPLWPRPEDSPSSRAYIVEHGIRSLADWRTTLDFISRVQQIPHRELLELRDPEPKIIDHFNTFIVAGAQPTLGHKMLAQLMRPLRIRTVLTTNFDTLIEDAAGLWDMPLRKFLVSIHGELPDAFSVRSQPSIIKLHGELIETRANQSLDEEPSSDDLNNFLQYFVDHQDVHNKIPSFRSVPSHLLVAGFSASDLRIIRFIQHLLDRTGDFKESLKPTVFWVAVTKWDVQQVERLFPASEYSGRVWIHRTDRPDLLLYQMYQRLTLSLPGGGMTHEYSHNVPPNRFGTARFDAENTETRECIGPAVRGTPTLQERKDARDELARIVGKQLSHIFQAKGGEETFHDQPGGDDEVGNLYFLQPGSKIDGADGEKLAPYKRKRSQSGDPRPSEMILVDQPYGMLEALNIAHAERLTKPGQNCLWFELADYMNADSVLRDILRAITLRMGRFQREQVTLHPLSKRIDFKDKEQTEELATFLVNMSRVYRMSPDHWTIFIYGREVAGSCVGWYGTNWTLEDWQNFENILRVFASTGFRVVYAIPSRSRYFRSETKRIESLKEFQKFREHEEFRDFDFSEVDAFAKETRQTEDRIDLEKDLPAYDSKTLDGASLSLFASMMEHLKNRWKVDLDFRGFLYSVTLFRQSRRPSALFYEGVQHCPDRFNLFGIDNDLKRSERATVWTTELEDLRLFYTKAGGHLWMHRDLRIAIRQALEQDVGKSGNDDIQRFQGQGAARRHFFIGDWYFKAFCSTGYTLPIIECLHHRFESAMTSPFAVPGNYGQPTTEKAKTSLVPYRYSVLRSSILEMIKTLIVAKPYLKLWLPNKHGFPMFTHDCAIHNSGNEQGDVLHVGKELQRAATRLFPDDKNPRSPDKNDPRYREIKAQIKRLKLYIRRTNRAIKEESNINRETFSIPATSHTFKPVEAPMRGFGNQIYEDSWDDDKIVRKLLSTILHDTDVEDAIARLVQFDHWRGLEFRIPTYATEKADCLSLLAPKFELLLPLLELFDHLAYARLRRAKFLQHGTRGVDTNGISRMPTIRKAWLKVAQLCNLGIDWCRHLCADHLGWEMQLKVRLHSYYAIALANLDRFFEAHRHLDEASGLNSKRELTLPTVELAKLRLRRAELFLTEAHRLHGVLAKTAAWMLKLELHNIKEHPSKAFEDCWNVQSPISLSEPIKPMIHPYILRIMPTMPIGHHDRSFVSDIARVLTATLDDAWVHLTYAEQALAGQSQSNLWWGRLSAMKLRAFGYQSYSVKGVAPIKILAYRHRLTNPQVLWATFESSYLNNGNSQYRRYRLIRYIAEALRACFTFDDEVEFIKKRKEDLLKIVSDIEANKGSVAQGRGSKSLMNEMLQKAKVACNAICDKVV